MTRTRASAKKAGTWTITVPANGAKFINLNQRMHWAPKAALTRRWRNLTATLADGPQSPDLAAAYVSQLLGHDWLFPYPYAEHLWEDSMQVMLDFERIEKPADFRRGDLVVFAEDFAGGISPFGTVGILAGDQHAHLDTMLDVFTQAPGPARIMTLLSSSALGAWRLTAGAECEALADKYAARHGGRWTIEGGSGEVKALVEGMLTDDVMSGIEREAADDAVERFTNGLPKLADSVVLRSSTPADPTGDHWMKALHTAKPGDILTFGFDGIKHGTRSDYGYTVVAHGRHWAARSLLGRLWAALGQIVTSSGPKAGRK